MGNTTFDTQTCQPCTSNCPGNTYVNDNVCTGKSFADVGMVDMAYCAPCPVPCRQEIFEIRAGGGCNGKDRNQVPICIQCAALCQRGQYISQMCQAGNFLPTCLACTEQCPVGHYFESPCSGDSYNVQDIKCTPCEPCPSGQYISRMCPGGNVIKNDTRQCSPCTSSCLAGFFLSGSCETGRNNFNAVFCSACSPTCKAPGTYMHAPCNGTTKHPDSNDCRPCLSCSLGRYMSSGACRDGSARNSSARTCSLCKPCQTGQYILPSSRCNGNGVEDTQTCESCSPCPRGSYISSPCNGVSSVKTCTVCKTCPEGYYRVGCNGSSSSDDVQCIQCKSCVAGQWIRNRCNGSGFGDEEQVCVDCTPCALGQYYASGCTGTEGSQQNRICAQCKSLCNPGTYVAKGCRGDAFSFQDTPSVCQPCSRQCSIGSYLSELCSGRTFSPGVAICSPCTCPSPQTTRIPCSGTNGLQDHLCSGGFMGVDRAAALTTTPVGGLQMTTTQSAASLSTPPPPSSFPKTTTTTTPPPGGGGDDKLPLLQDTNKMAMIFGGGAAGLLVLGLAGYYFCFSTAKPR